MHDPSSSIGKNIRSRRQALGLSLDALAQASGVSSTMLSEVERARKNPTVKLAYQIARALGCSLTDLLEDSPAVEVSIVRADQRRTLVDPDTQVVRHGLRSSLLDRNLELAWYELPAGESSGEMGANLPGMVELATVVEGSVEVVLGGRSFELELGDSITYGPQSTTEYRNPGDEPAQILLLIDTSKVHGASSKRAAPDS
ncbi:transcriptional regulator, XRE family with cupin sensor [Plesiocystis pacifica SIR-1]|uniref:Transcriptional regulator, XRE family with cupin sensor n=1 Tax=Plesiocystis pacifica SIR-1 TaxID=391625 RepID=A6G914_9BACT|nr:XRE family transcriptional regulator [Plesiocystis pacifica]EDM77700.1 transcriptional regulator, XRE family with cupin sensor [Plesiocystis pacifica SIR-1]